MKIKIWALLLVSAVLAFGAFAQPIAFQSGVYWDPERPGLGFSVDVHGNQVFLVAFSYDTDGQPVWYAGQSSFDGGNVVRIDLTRFVDGPCLICDDVDQPGALGTESPGTVTLDFTGVAGIELVLDGSEKIIRLERFPLFLIRSEGTIAGETFSLPDFSGQWLFTDVDGDAFHLVTELESAPSGVSDSGVAFFLGTDGEVGLTCSETVEGRLRCELREGDQAFEGPSLLIAEQPDLSHDRMVGDGVVGIRLR